MVPRAGGSDGLIKRRSQIWRAARTGGLHMGHYLIQLAYTADAANAMVKHPQNREETARAAMESLGGKALSFFFAFGDYDAIIIAELPSNAAAAAAALATVSGGAIAKFHTTPLLAPAEAVEAMKLAQKVAYAPPK